MLLQAIDKLLDKSFQKDMSGRKLNQLESDVWRQIRLSKEESRSTSFMLPVWSNTHLRYASLLFAFIGGLAVSQMYLPQNNTTRNISLGLEIFAPNDPFLVTSTFELIDPASL